MQGFEKIFCLRRWRKELVYLFLPASAALLFAVLIHPPSLSAEIIYLKNGRKIVAGIIREDTRTAEYYRTAAPNPQHVRLDSA